MTAEDIIDQIERTGERYVRNLGRFRIVESYGRCHGETHRPVFQRLTFEPSKRYQKRTGGLTMSDREKQIREWLKTLTGHELHLLKSKWIHDEQNKRRGIVTTTKQQENKS